MSKHGQSSKVESRLYVVAAGFVALMLFAVLSQPAWRGEAMAAEFKANCAKRGGVLLENKLMFGTNYECASRLGQ